MALRATELLGDVLEAIAAINTYSRGGKEVFDRDPMVRDAISTRLIQIGQAVKDAMAKGLDLRALHPEIPWRDVAGMRDRLAHNYRTVNPQLIWTAVEVHLPRLEAAVRDVLSTARSPGPSKPYRRSGRSRPAR